ncbi:modulator of transcription [Escherichia phage vb_EcoM-VR5]|uniref:Modulator of transcription n=1 Tax=Escherichia phage vb_EcoM-VR5 TaxID=1567026 RepID=A0A0A7HEC0_9CAUD|nr:decoy of host sigma32 [Escherichia phage vb_EcoM-VR5]AIZ01810.1 modulator of transcription [Escherichia phage vb_EcoM-VR5]UPW37736.1 molybdenum ABC transporter, periplasmic molybdenum-binding [Escherichia phage vB_EcoM_ESCO10]
MKPLSWLKDWLDRPSGMYIDDGWVDQVNKEMQNEAEEWAANGIQAEREKRIERSTLKLMRDIYGDKS